MASDRGERNVQAEQNSVVSEFLLTLHHLVMGQTGQPENVGTAAQKTLFVFASPSHITHGGLVGRHIKSAKPKK